METNPKSNEKSIIAGSHENLIKAVFDNIRNLFISATLAVGGGAVAWHSGTAILPKTVDVFIGITVSLAAIGLCIWNCHDGIVRILKPRTDSIAIWVYYTLIIATYLIVHITIFSALAKMYATQFN